MILPSSPPLLPETDFFQSSSPPPLPAVLSINLNLSASSNCRKRQFSDHDSQSSDPLFSDSTTNSDLFTTEGDQPKKKRFVRGPWWYLRCGAVESQNPQHAAKRRSGRNADSGIWMGSDETDDSTGTDNSSHEIFTSVPSVRPQVSRQIPTTIGRVKGETLAAKYIQQCLDAGQERIDLSNNNLGHLSGPTLNLLHQLIKPVHVDSFLAPSEEEFIPLTPSIQLYLASNSLHTLPSELYSLDNITVLSLRNNDLDFLDPAIGNLINLKELNIAGNRLQFLPWELAQLMAPTEGRKVTIRPNPLVSMAHQAENLAVDKRIPKRLLNERSSDSSHEGREHVRYSEDCIQSIVTCSIEELHARLRVGRESRVQQVEKLEKEAGMTMGREEMIFLGASPILHCGPDGRPLRRNSTRHTSPNNMSQSLTDRDKRDTSSACPSLRELSLRSLQSLISTHDFSSVLEMGLSPSIKSSVQNAISFRSGHGNHKCSRCQKSYIIPRAYWLEFWYHGLPSRDAQICQAIVPFMKMTCATACAQPSRLGSFFI